MLDYKLYKQLKDAGFPQGIGKYLLKAPGEKEYRPFDITVKEGYENFLPAGYDMIYIPTLPQLLEACGDKFLYLKRGTENENGKWEASGNKHQDMSDSYSEGKTAKIAVIKLWLELNKK